MLTLTAAILPIMATSQLTLHRQTLQMKESEAQQSKGFTFCSCWVDEAVDAVEEVGWSAMKSSKGTRKQRYCSSGNCLVCLAASFAFLCPGRRGYSGQSANVKSESSLPVRSHELLISYWTKQAQPIRIQERPVRIDERGQS
jgi:hypothetical protein